MSHWLECNCGAEVFQADEDGMFWDCTTDFCRECGRICTIGTDDLTAYVQSNDEAKDIGQPKCDRSCGAVEAFNGTSCLWDCERAKTYCDEWKLKNITIM